MPTTLEFLQSILPPEGNGLYCSVEIDDGKPRQLFFETRAQLAKSVLAADRRMEGTHGAVYHGCATYSRRSRTKDAVQSLSSLWLDIDAGPGKPYADAQAAVVALAAFVASC